MKEITCIVCPEGCRIEVEVEAGKDNMKISGHRCPRGERYARAEMTEPRRMLTGVVRVVNPAEATAAAEAAVADSATNAAVFGSLADFSGTKQGFSAFPRLLPVRTLAPIPKETIFRAMDEIRKISVTPPIKRGDIISKDLAGTGVPLIATGECLL